jgi:cell division protein FtsB
VKKKRQSVKAPIAQFVAIIALSISVFLVVDFGRRAAANYRIQREADRLSQEVEAARKYQAELLARRTYVASNLYIEEIARNELKWAKPDETVIVIMPTPEAVTSTPNTSTNSDAATPVVQTPNEAWWQLFFGDRIPSQ